MAFSLTLVYFLNLCLFLSTNNPVIWSIVLMVNSCIISLLFYLYIGACWYSLVVSMVYLGGVYIIILFVSSHLQNDENSRTGWWYSSFGLLSAFLFWCSVWLGWVSANEVTCTWPLLLISDGGVSVYFIVSLILLVMFLGLSVTGGVSSGHVR
uniref:NADH dehydrogenase subunit 6 n=1 Tax=Hexostoma thynni TaxID=92220 RepID=UPI0022371E93|nr:NADH dehydrogenase subunit 6 [Hexostoma thynni]UYC28898.1 NADH dehydrogenase subunit 6 [Hexostoma thynni]